MTVKVTEHVHWIGKIDWELRKFHGEDYSTHRGSTYNAYLITDEKTAIIDTVWTPYAKEFVETLKKELNGKPLDYIIANHGEVDHSGALPDVMKAFPGTPIYCTANAVHSLKGQFHEEWEFRVVKTGDQLSLGKQTLTFIEAPMLHWPDSMFEYLDGDQILFSNDAFGQHYASELLFNDLVDPCELFQEAIKYYANILTPFSELVIKKIEQWSSLNLPLQMICPSHGVIWRKNPVQIVEKYLSWASRYQEEQVTIVYDSMWEGTRIMAEAITEGLQPDGKRMNVKIFNAARSDKNDIITQIFKSKAILVGCPTVNKGILAPIAGLLEEISGLRMKGKKGAAFGCYGWSGEGNQVLVSALKRAGFEVIIGPIKTLWKPTPEDRERCKAFGAEFQKMLEG